MKIIMHENNQKFTVSARDIWEKLGSKQEFSHWISYQSAKYDLKDGRDFLIKNIKNPNGRPRIQYYLTKEASRLILEDAGVMDNENNSMIPQDISIFNFNQERVRVVLNDNEPWFVLKDLASILDIQNPKEIKNRLEKDEVDYIYLTDNLGRKQNTTIVNESGLYEVLFASRKKEALQFKKWIKTEVLPSIRKTGSYSNKQELTKLELLELALESEKQKLLLEEKNKMNERKLELLTHTKRTYTATDIAKELGLRSAIELNEILNHKKVIFKDQKGDWQPYAKFSDIGYFEKKQEILDSGKEVYYMRFTQKGREFVLQLIKEKGA